MISFIRVFIDFPEKHSKALSFCERNTTGSFQNTKPQICITMTLTAFSYPKKMAIKNSAKPTKSADKNCQERAGGIKRGNSSTTPHYMESDISLRKDDLFAKGMRIRSQFLKYELTYGLIFRFMWFCFTSIGAVATCIIIVSLWEKFQTNPTITGICKKQHDFKSRGVVREKQKSTDTILGD